MRVFQSSPAPKGRCNAAAWYLERKHKVSILTGPEGPMQPGRSQAATGCHPVSILTGPEGPMQQAAAWYLERKHKVSILTGPEGPMQRHRCTVFRTFR